MDDDDNGKSGHRERLRERFAHGDASSRTDEALLELLLTFGIPRRDVKPLADALLARFGDLTQVLAADLSALKALAPELAGQIKITSAELADHWYEKEATDAEKAGVRFFFDKEHKCSPEEFRNKSGPKKFGQELVRSKLPKGRLRGKFKERFAYIYDQITKLSGCDGIVFVVDEFRSWQDRHPAGTPTYAEDEEVLETLGFVLPTQHLNIITIIASQGDMPQKLSGGGEGDRFLPLYLLADKNKGDFGEIVTFRCRELLKGASTDIKDYYDYCRKEYKFIKQANISQDYFTAIFPFQPRCFDVMRRLTQNAEKHNLPTARSAIRMAWQALSDAKLLKGKRLIVLPDIIKTDELRKGLNHEHYRDAYLNLQGSIEQLAELGLATEERDQCEAILQTLLLWVLSLPDNQRDGLTAQEVAEAAWLHDDAVGAAAQAENILELLLSHGFPVRKEKKTRGGEEVAIYSYETSVVQANPVKFFAPLKKKFIQDKKRQDEKWVEAADIKEGKNDPIYNAHSYHTKVPPRSIIPYILHYTQPGDLVLDVFCGSGMTGWAAQMCAHPPADLLEQFPELRDRVGPRACILNDLSPAACHIAYNYNTPVDVDAVKREFERIKAAVKQEFDWLYGTEHYEPAVAQ